MNSVNEREEKAQPAMIGFVHPRPFGVAEAEFMKPVHGFLLAGFAVLGLIASGVAQSANSGNSSAATPLRGTYWMLSEVHGKPVAPASNNPAFLYFDADGHTYSGSSGCNRVTGKFQLSGDSLQLLGGAQTMMACPEPLMTQEKEFNQALTATGSYKINGSVLELYERKKIVAKFEPGKQPQ
jgi:heat shock protein HslJ